MCKENETDRVLELLKRYGYHSQSYNILRSDKSYFYSSSGIDGVIAYVVKANVAMAAGDPVCNPSNIHSFVTEFRMFCKERKLLCCFQSITERCKDILEDMGFGIIKIGEEPIFDLEKFSLEGSKFRGLRKNINQAKKQGLSVVEYHPLLERQPEWEKDMEELSAIWQKFKGSGEFSFLIGEPALDNPKDRKYFLALLDNKVEAFVVCTPVYTRNGIYFDVMRRREKTPNGMPQLLFTESFRILKEQGYTMATLGTAPLSHEHVDDPDQNRIIKLALKLAFNRLGHFYRFKPLYKFKRQFGPTSWEGRYLAFSPKLFNPVILYALLKVYDPTGVTKKLLYQLNSAWKGINKIKDGTVDFIGSTSGSVIKGIKGTSHKAVTTTKKTLHKIPISIKNKKNQAKRRNDYV
jgi:phosphatidylglycerol lysyltransferase